MKQYKDDGLDGYTIGNMTIPKDMANRHYRELLKEVDLGKAEIVTYTSNTDVNETVDRDIQILKSESVIDAMIDFMDGKSGKFQAFKSKLDNLKAKLK